MRPLFFCNIGWMSRYEGLKGKPDKIVGGGRWVDENEAGGEVCNFLVADDGYVYGHVETIKGDLDRSIRLKFLGGSGESVSGIDVVWTATNPQTRGRRIVGWYTNATIWRDRQDFERSPSRQHRLDKLTNYRIRASAKELHRVEIDDRTLVMGRGSGWMGHTPWWMPPQSAPGELGQYVRRVRGLIAGTSTGNQETSAGKPSDRKSPGTATDPYSRYIQAYEVTITPRHSKLQNRFERFLARGNAADIQPNMASVDLRFRDSVRGLVLAEIKPCEASNVRYAIRIAIGQLLDYLQRAREKASMLIVLEIKLNDNDQMLAISNGFGLAFPSANAFEIIWPA